MRIQFEYDLNADKHPLLQVRETAGGVGEWDDTGMSAKEEEK